VPATSHAPPADHPVLLSGEGLSTTVVAERTGVSRRTVILWGNRYLKGGVDALADLPRPGWPSVRAEGAYKILAHAKPRRRTSSTRH